MVPAVQAPARQPDGAIDWHGSFSALPVAIVDVETTGLDPAVDRIVEIAVVAGGDLLLETLVRPQPLADFAGPHGLRAADVSLAPTFPEVADRLWRLLTGRIVVGHVVGFDLAFLREEFGRAGQLFPDVPFICTAALAELLELRHERRRLAYACQRHSVPLRRPHGAGDDALAAAALFARYGAIADARGANLPALMRAAPDEQCVRSWTLAPLGPLPPDAEQREQRPVRLSRR